MYPGAYKNVDELEDSLTRDELIRMYEKAYDLRHDEKRFIAAMQGHDIGDRIKTGEVTGEDVVKRALAKAKGMSEEEYDLDGAFNIIDEDDEE